MKTPEEFLEDKGWHKDSNIVGGALWMGMVEILKEYAELVKNHCVSHHVSYSIATEYAVFAIECTRNGMSVLNIDDYVKQYCS